MLNLKKFSTIVEFYDLTSTSYLQEEGLIMYHLSRCEFKFWGQKNEWHNLGLKSHFLMNYYGAGVDKHDQIKCNFFSDFHWNFNENGVERSMVFFVKFTCQDLK